MAWAKKRKFVPKRKTTTRKRAQAPTKSLATQVVSAIGGYALKRLKAKLGLNTETHYNTVATATFTPTTTLAKQIDILTSAAIPQDDTAQGRAGQGVRVTRWHLKGTLDNGAANLLTTRVRIIICRNKGVGLGASALVIADILERTTDINSPHLIDQTADVAYLYDRTFFFDPSAQGGTPQTINWEWNWKPLSHHLRWTAADTTGTSADLLDGLVSVFMMSDAFTASNAPTLNIARELYWVDN